MTFSCLVEDSYGEYFWPDFFKKKKEEKILHNLGKPRKIQSCTTNGPKLNSMISNYLKSDDEYVLLLFDAHGKNISDASDELLSKINSEFYEKVKIHFFDYEIEEWICHTLGKKYKDERPSKILKHQERYEKNHLPRFVEKLDCDKLKDCPSYIRFLEIVKN